MENKVVLIHIDKDGQISYLGSSPLVDVYICDARNGETLPYLYEMDNGRMHPENLAHEAAQICGAPDWFEAPDGSFKHNVEGQDAEVYTLLYTNKILREVVTIALQVKYYFMEDKVSEINKEIIDTIQERKIRYGSEDIVFFDLPPTVREKFERFMQSGAASENVK